MWRRQWCTSLISWVRCCSGRLSIYAVRFQANQLWCRTTGTTQVNKFKWRKIKTSLLLRHSATSYAELLLTLWASALQLQAHALLSSARHSTLLTVVQKTRWDPMNERRACVCIISPSATSLWCSVLRRERIHLNRFFY